MAIPGPCYQPVHVYLINPKAVTIGELYGKVDIMTNEWQDGLIGFTVRHACSVSRNLDPSKSKAMLLLKFNKSHFHCSVYHGRPSMDCVRWTRRCRMDRKYEHGVR